MSDTPRTDAVAFGGNVIKSFEQGHAVLEQESQFVDAEHARQLERELHAMTLRCQAADRTANAALAARPEALTHEEIEAILQLSDIGRMELARDDTPAEVSAMAKLRLAMNSGSIK